jgi:23S rRNA pseudouridine1911/1915/1917 synthase
MSKKWQIFRLQVEPDVKSERLDVFLANCQIDMSRTRAKRIIDIGGVHINGRRVRSCSTQVSCGDSLEVYIDHLSLDPFRICDEHVLFHDQYLIALNKPPHIDTQPTHARFKGTLYEALQWYLKDPFKLHLKPEIGMVQRLDRGTSGIIVFSIHQRVHGAMTKLFVEHGIDKRYLALVHGSPAQDQGEICSLLARSRRDNRVRSVAKGGKEALTRYRVIERFNACSLVEVELLTGRSHQIRAHMAELGHPLVGDVRYGGADKLSSVLVDRPLLHAAHLSFNHPLTHALLKFETSPAKDMQLLLGYLREGKL